MSRIILLFTIISFIGCSDQKNSEYLPQATGRPGDMVLIMDSVQWKGNLGKEIRKVLMAEVPGLPQSEPMFKVSWVHPSKSFKLLTQIRNLVYVFTLDQNTSGSKILRQQFSPEALSQIQNDTSFYLSYKTDEYARGQQVMYLFGTTEQNLISHLQRNKQNIIDHFNRVERERLTADILRTKSTKGLVDFLRKEQQCEIQVPVGYKLADRKNDFVWLRSMTAVTDKDVFITWKTYESEYQLLPDSLVEWRNAICKKYLFEDPENFESYLVTEQEDATVLARQVNLNKRFAMELRGLWRTNIRTMGGPFVGYALVDEPRGLLYYIEGFAYAPGKDKREFIRELEAILWTFKTSDEIKKDQ